MHLRNNNKTCITHVVQTKPMMCEQAKCTRFEYTTVVTKHTLSVYISTEITIILMDIA